jgi:arylsulfatase A-like enzyme
VNEPTIAPRCRLLPLLARLLLVAFWAATLAGALDVALHARELPFAAALASVGLYALFGMAGTLLALPFAALAIVALRGALGGGRAALLVAWLGVVALVLLLLEKGALPIAAALVLLLLASAAALRSWQGERFDAAAPWRLRGWGALALAVAFIAAPPLLRRAATVAAAVHAPRGDGRPDLVLIVLDTTRADFLGAYGHDGNLTPRFDQFARDGVLYERCMSAAPWTVPSHASLFTSLFPPSHGASFEHHRWLDSRFTTLAEALKERGGYQTAAFVANEYLDESNLLQGFDLVQPLGVRGRELAIQPLIELLGWPAPQADHGAAEAVERIDRFLARERDGDAPLFLFVNLMEAHWRFLPALAERIAQTEPSPGLVTATDVSRRYYGPLAMAGRKVAGPLEESLRALYSAAVQYQDRQLGLLLDSLDRSLGRERTFVAITADHGENLGDGGRFDHVVDVAPTLLDAAELQPGGPLHELSDGRTLLPGRFVARDVVLGFGDPYLGHLERVAPIRGFNRDVVDLAAVLRSIGDGERKLVRRLQNGAVVEQLFAPATDRAERDDLATSEAARFAALSRRLDEELAKLPIYEGPPLAPPSDPDLGGFDEAALRAAGYVADDK